MDNRNWDREQVRGFVKGTIAAVGGRSTWRYMSRPQRVHAIKAMALDVVAGQLPTEIEIHAVRYLVSDMLDEAGLSDN